jgi:mannose-1-phosphate guanylyltransferase
MKLLNIVIIAGGKGERFWPRSVRLMPKQFQPIVTKRTMIQETFYRVYPDIDRERIHIVAGGHLSGIILEQIEEIDTGNLIVEPVGRNTAPAIGLAAAYISRSDPEAVVAVLAADHVVEPRYRFLEALEDAYSAALEGYIVTFGIKPSRPATEFGYIEADRNLEGNFGHEIYTVKRFMEKPSSEKAQEYVEAGNFFWNSGMFIFQASSLFDAMQKHMPSLYRGLMTVRDSIGTPAEEQVKAEVFESVENISIDYGIMEKAERIACLKPKFSWDDVGSWGSIERHRGGDERGNIVEGNVIVVDSESNIVLGDNRSIISLIGMKDTIVVKAGDRLLVCNKFSDQKIKDALKRIAADESLSEYL